MQVDSPSCPLKQKSQISVFLFQGHDAKLLCQFSICKCTAMRTNLRFVRGITKLRFLSDQSAVDRKSYKSSCKSSICTCKGDASSLMIDQGYALMHRVITKLRFVSDRSPVDRRSYKSSCVGRRPSSSCKSQICTCTCKGDAKLLANLLVSARANLRFAVGASRFALASLCLKPKNTSASANLRFASRFVFFGFRAWHHQRWSKCKSSCKSQMMAFGQRTCKKICTPMLSNRCKPKQLYTFKM